VTETRRGSLFPLARSPRKEEEKGVVIIRRHLDAVDDDNYVHSFEKYFFINQQCAMAL
jgi:hypothetical protein